MQSPNAKQQIDIMKYLHLFWRRKWIVFPPIVVFPIVAALWSMSIPDSFKSTTLILVQAQRVPTQFVPSTVTATIEERLNTINQQILSRTRLEEIIKEFGLFKRERNELSPEEVIDLMRRRISLKVYRNDAFQLSYVDPEPRLAMLVTNKLASLFIDENLKVREQQAVGTSQFLNDEIERIREQVRQKEDAIYAFKQSHMTELTDQVASNQARLTQLQNQLQITNHNINAAEDRKIALQQQLSLIDKRLQDEYETRAKRTLLSAEAAKDEPIPTYGDDGRVKALEAEIDRHRRELENLRSTYTEKHPEVTRAVAVLKRLEKELARETEAGQRVREAAAAPRGKGNEAAASAQNGKPAAYHQARAELERVQLELKRLRSENEQVQRSIELYQSRIAAAPPRELELKKISQDYENLKTTMDNLVAKKLQAELSENLEKKQKGEQFQILDPANTPEKPFAPNRLVFVFGGLALGLALGAGSIVLLDLLNLNVKTREELTEVLGIPVLAAIPEIVTAGDVARARRFRLIGTAGAAAVVVVASLIVHVAVRPLPRALSELYSQARKTHWTTMQSKN